MKKIKLNIGSGFHFSPGFISVDGYITKEQMLQLYGSKIPKGADFVQGKVQDLPFGNNYADYIETIDMIEHLPMADLTRAFSEMYRVLKPGGMLRIVTTSFDDVVKSWLDASRELTEMVMLGEDYSKVFDETYSDTSWETIAKKRVNLAMMVIYGNQFHGGELHMNAFTPAIMSIYLRNAGFKKEKIKLIVHTKGSLAPTLPAAPKMATNSSLVNDTIVAEAIKGTKKPIDKWKA